MSSRSRGGDGHGDVNESMAGRAGDMCLRGGWGGDAMCVYVKMEEETVKVSDVLSDAKTEIL